MARFVFRLIVASLIALEASVAAAQPPLGERIDVPPVPPPLEVPVEHTVFLKGHAAGTQNYVCLPTPSGPAWKFVAPQATLFQQLGSHLHQQIATHFLAPNPFEPGVFRPSWQHSFDSSQIWGQSIASSSDPEFVEAGAMPWLLLEIVGAKRGTFGTSHLAQTTFIQRLNTSGGLPPSTACGPVGALLMVPYRTDYYFYRARHPK